MAELGFKSRISKFRGIFWHKELQRCLGHFAMDSLLSILRNL